VSYFVFAFRVENKSLIPQKLRKILVISAAVAVFAGLTVFTIYGRMRDKTASVTNLIYDAIDLSYMKLYKIFPYNLYVELADIAIEEGADYMDVTHIGLGGKWRDGNLTMEYLLRKLGVNGGYEATMVKNEIIEDLIKSNKFTAAE
jgi:hypothetical protein